MTRIIHLRLSRFPFLAIALGVVAVAATRANAQDGQPPEGRQPVITNQFATTTGGALQARRPGLFIQQGIGVNQGTVSFFDGNVDDSDSFFQETSFLIIESFMNTIMSFLDTINLASAFIDFGTIFGGGNGTAPPATIPNAATAGQGTTTPIP